MKPGFALWCAFSLLLGSMACQGLEVAATTTTVPSPPPIVADNQFFVDHPDLKDEAEVVDDAAKALAEEGFQAGTAKEASEALAAKSRAVLADRTAKEWEQKAVSLYPALGVAGSEFNLLFLKHYHELKTSSPAFIQEPSWPVLLAKRCDDELRSGSPAASPVVVLPTASASVTPAGSPTRHAAISKSTGQGHRSTNFWQTFIALLVLILLTALPIAFVFRPGLLTFQNGAFAVRHDAPAVQKRRLRQPAPPERTLAGKSDDPPIWRAALKHAAIIYVAVAVPASVHSLMVNSDLGFVDRLFVSLLVGILFGVFITLPLYGLDTLWHACLKHPARPATR
jgi:hypothetical protein